MNLSGDNRHLTNHVDLPGDRRSVTITYRYGAELVVVVAQDVPAAHAEARKRWGEPDEVTAISTPRSIYNDITGETARRHGAKGRQRTFAEEMMPSERASASSDPAPSSP